MTMFSNFSLKLPTQRRSPEAFGVLCAGALVFLVLLAGCAVEVENTQAARELAQRAEPPGSVYAGWRVFQDRCAGCHGAAATGSAGAPDLLPRVRDMTAQRFVNLVLARYDWQLSVTQPGGDAAAQSALVEEVVQGREGRLVMPAWQGEPRVNAHVVDLYAYLSARASGTQGVGRPPR